MEVITMFQLLLSCEGFVAIGIGIVGIINGLFMIEQKWQVQLCALRAQTESGDYQPAGHFDYKSVFTLTFLTSENSLLNSYLMKYVLVYF